MRKVKTLFLAVMMFCALGMFTGCADRNNPENGILDDAVNDVTEGVDKITDDVTDGVDKATDEMTDEIDNATDKATENRK